MKRLIIFAAGLAIGAFAGLGMGYARWHEPFDRFANDRRIVLNRAEDFPVGGVLLIGDSTVERLHLPELCGLPVFNAGISGARADQVQPVVKPLLDRLKPKMVIVAVGANDKDQGDPWEADLASFAPQGAVVLDAPPALAQQHGWRRIEPLPAAMLMDGIHANDIGRAELKRRFATACALI